METPPGLIHFPVTKIMMISSVGVSLGASLFNIKYWFLLQYEPFISEYKQYWRFGTFQLGSINESDVAIMTLIWYQFRTLERLFGSKKYANIIFLSWVYTTCVIFLLSNVVDMLLPGIWWDQFTNGPLPVLLCLTHFYKQYTPRLYEFNIAVNQPLLSNSRRITWKLTDQFLVNGLMFLCLLNQGLCGLGIGLISWICGVLLDRGLFPGLESFQLVPFKESWNRSQTTFNRPSTSMPDNINAEDPNEQEPDTPEDEPQRPLGVQFLDTFRR